MVRDNLEKPFDIEERITIKGVVRRGSEGRSAVLAENTKYPTEARYSIYNLYLGVSCERRRHRPICMIVFCLQSDDEQTKNQPAF